MNIQINTDKNIPGDASHTSWLRETIETSLAGFAHISRVDVYLTDQNGGKSGPDDKQCVLEVKQEGKQPIVVTTQSDVIDKAVLEALNKVDHVLRAAMDRQKDHSVRSQD